MRAELNMSWAPWRIWGERLVMVSSLIPLFFVSFQVGYVISNVLFLTALISERRRLRYEIDFYKKSLEDQLAAAVEEGLRKNKSIFGAGK